MAKRRTIYILLVLLALVLFGTVIAYLSDREVPVLGNTTRWNATEHGKLERIPRILHQTWKSETLPADWKRLSVACQNMMPDYTYPWFLDTYDDYEFTIQRADAIRYFILYHYGGIYLDLDIGCPPSSGSTIPVGVSNDLIFAEKGHPFLAQTIHNLVTFDHSWILNYPTVMFSTGPMFLSFQYSLYTASHPITPHEPGDVRILPKSLYGKNAKPEEAPHSFFTHYYGSSWHADDAAFIGFLNTWGKGLMWLAVPSKQRKYSLRRIGGYDVLLPRWTQRNGRWHIDMRWSFLPASGASTQPSSPTNSAPQSPLDEHVSLLPLPFDYRTTPSILDAVRRVRDRATGYLNLSRDPPTLPRAPSRSRRQRSRGVMFFLPAIFTQSQNMDIPPRSPPPQPSSGRNLPPSSQLPPEKLWQGFHQGCSQSPRPPLENRLPHSSSSPLVDLEQQNS
ncbi:glycosyltransferase family 32 protein [Suillus lakei]|nr:glycosyltransferase family 32 protein [Suillus lakei]